MFRLTTDAKKFERALQKMAEGALGKATARTLNVIAKGANIQQQRSLESKMIVRTPYTIKSLRTYSASESKPISRQNAVVGSVSPYLEVHEKGGMVRARKKYVMVPGKGQRGADRRGKIPARLRMNKLGNFSKGEKFFILDPAKNPGKPRKRAGKTIPYRLKKPAIFYRKGGKLVVVRRLVAHGVRVKGTHWHTDAVHKYAKVGTVSAVFAREAKKVMAELGAK